MKTKTIFKALALAMMMPAMMLTTACSSDDDAIINNDETPAKNGYSLPLTINVTRQGDDATTRATYKESTHKLEFSTGDKLFLYGDHASAGQFAGTLDWVSDGTFSGIIITQREVHCTALEFLDAADSYGTPNRACLLPAGYDSDINHSFLSISNPGTYYASVDYTYYQAIANSKAAAVEQLSYEQGGYTSGTGFVLEPSSAILNFTITGLMPRREVNAKLDGAYGELPSGIVTTDGDGTATFAMGVEPVALNTLTLTVDGNAFTFTSSDKILTKGHIYNITRSVPPKLADVFTDGAEVGVTVKNTNNTSYTVTGTYSDGDYIDITKSSNDISNVTMTKEGYNLVVWIKNDNNSECTLTFNTQNNTYTKSFTAGTGAAELNLSEFVSITVNGTDITSTLTDMTPSTSAEHTLAATMTTAGMTVKVNYNYFNDNYCLFVSNGGGTYTFQSGGGYAGDSDKAKALVVEGDKLVFKQNHHSTFNSVLDNFGFSFTFDTSNNTYTQWVGSDCPFTPSFTSVEVNGTTIAVTKQ